MKKAHPKNCGCAQCSDKKPFVPPEHLLSKIAAGEVVLFVGAGIGAQLKSLIARKTVIYVGYSLSDENYLRLLRNISKMMEGNIRQSYFVSPEIDPKKLSSAPIPLVPIETDGTYFFEQLREELTERCGIIREEAFDCCDLFIDEVAEKHDKTADAFIKTQHPLLIFILGYQDGLIHSLQRIARMRKTGEYHSTSAVLARMQGYDRKIYEFEKRKDFWNSAYALGYQNGLLFLALKSSNSRAPNPPYPLRSTPCSPKASE
jgi:thiamine pyrophosphate-dependent acetolactate synthase large subunit-like protein